MSKLDRFAPFRAAYKADAEKNNGPKYWRSLDHKAGEVDDFEPEFPTGTAVLPELQRREVLKIAGASLALAGLGGTACVRRPEEEILPYTHQPEEVIPGIATRYATVHPRTQGGLGLLVTAYEGRPTKIEGNPGHSLSFGTVDTWAQSEILRLYDPDRTRTPMKGAEHVSWADFDTFSKAHFDGLAQNGGQGLAFVVDGADKPTFDRLLGQAKAKWPNAQIFRWDPVNTDASDGGASIAFGPNSRVHLDVTNAKVMLALDSNFLVDGPEHLVHSKGWGARRVLKSKADADNMNRLYAVEGVFSLTGANADHRHRVPSSQIGAFLAAVAGELATAGVAIADLPRGAAPADSAKFAAAVAKDLAAHRGESLIIVGDRQPAAVHALAYAINAALGATEAGLQKVTTAVTPGVNLVASVNELAAALEGGKIDTLVVVDVNLAATTPGALKLADSLKKAKTVIHAGLIADETAKLAGWHVPLAHFLESWGDARAYDGTASIVQPLILPIFGARSEVSFLGGLLGLGLDDKKLVEETWSALSVAGKTWRRALHDGVVAGVGAGRVALVAPAAANAAVATAFAAIPAKGAGTLEVALTMGSVLDGRLANLGWNMELPDSMSKLVWDNALVISPALAKEVGINSRLKRNSYMSDVVSIDVGGRVIEAPTFVLPGLEKNSAYLHLGFGRQAGVVATGVGVSAYPLMDKDGSYNVVATIKPTGKIVELASTQDHFSRPGNPFNEVTFAEATTYKPEDKERVLGTTFDGAKKQSPVVRGGKLTQYKEHGAAFAHEGDIPANLVEHGTPAHRPAKPIQPTKEIAYDGQQWGMVIDLGACTGCNACVISCQAENNIPTVGREQVLLGREMHWLRIDRYFEGDVDNPTSVHQPMTCQHCENAPCEPVCPVGATVHDEEGINSMAYNRCIGTRYCANNCPFKVRRYNYFDFTVTANVYRDAEKVKRADVYKLQRNPNVTVRYRGVMEKCSYCTQRVEAAKIAFKNAGGDRRQLKDGAVITACQQVCPTGAITFGNINDETSKVHVAKLNDRNYELLQELNIRPRTSYLARLKNNNPELEG
jgi:Fe-S-cluster-containing dehydrogenase component/anaerobic selenocysteine-containing dehydrogenase